MVDHAEVVSLLRERLLAKNSWGQRELLTLLAELEGECRTDDDAYLAFLRRFGVELEEAFINRTNQSDSATTGAPAGAPGMQERSTDREPQGPEGESWRQTPPRRRPRRRPQRSPASAGASVA